MTATPEPTTTEPTTTDDTGSRAATAEATTPAAANAPGPGRRSRRTRWILVAVVILVVASLGFGAVTLALSPTTAGGIGDTKPQGHAALTQLIRYEGVTVTETDRFASLDGIVDGDTTIVINQLSGLTPPAWRALLDLGPGRVVLLQPLPIQLRRLDLTVSAVDPVTEVTADPACSDPAAEQSGTITVPSRAVSYQAAEATVACYRSGAGHLLVAVTVADSELVVMPRIGTNDLLDREGNAALTMQVLGTRPHALWYHPTGNDTTMPGNQNSNGGGDDRVVPTLLPSGWLHAVGLAAVSLVVIAIWRGRRLGPVIVEDLPSVVPASETVEGHGALYERLAARDTAAAHLRTATGSRLSRLLGRTEDPEILAQALADRTGWPYGEIRHLLDGSAPATDDQLVTLKRKLDALEQEARRP